MTSMRQVLAYHTRRLRMHLDMTQTALAKASGYTRTQLTNIEAARSGTSIEGVGRIAAALQVEPGALLGSVPTCSACGQILPEGGGR